MRNLALERAWASVRDIADFDRFPLVRAAVPIEVGPLLPLPKGPPSPDVPIYEFQRRALLDRGRVVERAICGRREGAHDNWHPVERLPIDA